MKAGQYTISDWMLSDLTWRCIIKDVPYNHTQFFGHVSIYKRFIYQQNCDKWVISITDYQIDDCHTQMYHVYMMSILFNSKEEAKQYVDTFLDKLCKLKVFL